MEQSHCLPLRVNQTTKILTIELNSWYRYSDSVGRKRECTENILE